MNASPAKPPAAISAEKIVGGSHSSRGLRSAPASRVEQDGDQPPGGSRVRSRLSPFPRKDRSPIPPKAVPHPSPPPPPPVGVEVLRKKIGQCHQFVRFWEIRRARSASNSPRP